MVLILINMSKATLGMGSIPIDVYLRFKPESGEKNHHVLYDNNEDNVIQYKSTNGIGHMNSQSSESFRFDSIYQSSTTNKQLCERLVVPIITDLFEGYSHSLITYGQSGSGKSFSLFYDHGLALELFNELFQKVSNNPLCFVSVSMVEVINDKVFDLMTSPHKQIGLSRDSESHYHLKPIREVFIRSESELLSYTRDTINSADCKNLMITINLKQLDSTDDTLTVSSLTIFDLAPNFESYQALLSKNMHFSHTSLTKVLDGSFNGNTKTTVLLTASSETIDQKETLHTLEIGRLFKQWSTHPILQKSIINEQEKLNLFHSDMEMKELSYITQIKFLEMELNEYKLHHAKNKINKDELFKELEFKTKENEKLSDQLASLTKVLNLPPTGDEDNEEKLAILNTLLQKIADTMVLQHSLDQCVKENDLLEKLVKNQISNERELENMNSKLLDYINSQEQEVQNLLTNNSKLKTSLNEMTRLVESFSEKIQNLEDEVKHTSLRRHLSHGHTPSTVSSSSVTTVVEGDDKSTSARNSWLSGTTQKTNTSYKNQASPSKQEKFHQAGSGFQLNVIKPT